MFFQCCTTALTNPSWKFGIEYSQIMKWWLSANAIVERLFSRMKRGKTDFCNRLSRSRLDTCLRVGEEGLSIKDFEPDRIIDRWWTDKERRLKSPPHNYPANKRPRWNSQSMLICQHLRCLIWKTVMMRSVFPYRYTCL